MKGKNSTEGFCNISWPEMGINFVFPNIFRLDGTDLPRKRKPRYAELGQPRVSTARVGFIRGKR
jgi:hypothetical protein